MKKAYLHFWGKVTASAAFLAVTLFIFSASALMTGCQKKQEQPQQQSNSAQTDTTANKAVDTTKKADTTNKGAASAANATDLKGTWNGKMGAFRTTLKVTEQNGNDFKGNISMSFRDPINQQVSGKFDPEKGTLTMRDVLKQRYQGKYSGKISGSDKLTGTYTLADGQKFNFNLSKK